MAAPLRIGVVVSALGCAGCSSVNTCRHAVWVSFAGQGSCLAGAGCDKAVLRLLTSVRSVCRLVPESAPAPAPADGGGGALRIRESGALKREALLDCLDTARGCYRHAWARTSVDLAIEVGAPALGALRRCDTLKQMQAAE